MSKIQEYPKQEQIDRSEQLLPKSWVWSEGSSVLTDTAGRNKQIRTILENTSTLVCLLTQRIEDSMLVGYLHELAQRERRVYLLLGEYSSALEQLLGHCLIRILPQELIPSGSLLLTDPSSNKAKSFLLSDPLVAQPEGSIGLLSPSIEGEKGRELFHYFCYLFWERARREYLCDKDRKGREIIDKGRDVYFDPTQLHPEYLYDQFLRKSEGLSRRALLGRYISLAGSVRHLRIEQSETLDLRDITFSQLHTREELEGARPNKFPDTIGYLMTTYHWRVVPFYRPSEAKLSDYYKKWEGYTEGKKQELEGLINEIESKLKSSHSDKGADYASLYVNFEKELREIQKGISLLIDVRWGYDHNTSEKQHEAERLTAQYKAACTGLELDVKKLDLERELTAIRKEIESLKKDLARHREELKQQEGEGKDEQEKSKTKEAEEKTKQFETELKGLKGKENNVERELRRLTTQSKGVKESSDLGNFTTPILPSVGELYQTSGKLYLAIDNWEDYEEAHKEAQRLGAVLCASGE